MRNNIIYIGNFDFTSSNAAKERAMSNLKILKGLGHECNIIGFGERRETLIIDGIRVLLIEKPNSTLKWIKYQLNSKNISSLFSQELQNITIFYNLPSMLSIMIRMKFRSKTKFIADVTEWYSTVGLSIIKRIAKSADINLRMRYLNKRMDGLIVISDYLRQYYKQSPNVIMIPPLVNEEIFDTKLHFYKGESNVINFIYSGFPGPDKDRLDLIVKSFGELSEEHPMLNYQLNIYGPTYSQLIELFPDLKTDIKRIESNIFFHGHVSHEESIHALKKSDYCFLLRNSSRKNNAGFPTKFSEAFSLGIPIIYNDFSDLIMYTTDNDIFVPNLTVDEIKQQIIKSGLKNSVNGHNYRYDLSILNTKYISIFIDLLEKLNI